jgi:1-aminocyclopropane-1-carboxylate deaminase
LISYKKTNIKQLNCQLFEQHDVKFLIKREDLNHPFVSGNKWWKLKYNLLEAERFGLNTLLTFGGAYSNHIHATAAAANELGINSIGVIRGEETFPLNPTLSFARENGMQLHYVSREDYRKKTQGEFIKNLYDKFGDFYLIPEGGTNLLAVKGTTEFGQMISEEVDFDYVCLPVGTGGTVAGIAEGVDEKKKIIGFPVLKGASFLEAEIKKYTNKNNWCLIYGYHFGGYAKITQELVKFIKQFEEEYSIPLDPVYTGKMLFGIFDLIMKGSFDKGSKILVIHTGGLQGKAGFMF